MREPIPLLNPIESAYNLFINVFLSLPAPIQYFVLFAFALLAISTVVNMVFRG